MPQCAQWACIKKRHNTNTLWASNNRNETFLSGQKEAAETSTTTTTTTRFHCKHRVQVDGRKQTKKKATSNWWPSTRHGHVRPITHERGRDTRDNDAAPPHPPQTPPWDLPSERVRHYSHVLQWSRQKRKNLGLVRSCPTTSKKKKETLGPAGPIVQFLLWLHQLDFTLSSRLFFQFRINENAQKKSGKEKKKKKNRHDPFRWIAVTIPRESHPPFDNRKFLKKGSPLQRFPPLLPTTSIGSMHSVLWVSQVFFPSSSQETSICSSRKNRANHRDQKKKKKEPKVKKRDSLNFFSIHSTRTHFDGTVSSGGVE